MREFRPSQKSSSSTNNPQFTSKELNTIYNTRLRELLGPMGRHSIPFGMEVRVRTEKDSTQTPYLSKSEFTNPFYSKILTGDHPQGGGAVTSSHIKDGLGRQTL